MSTASVTTASTVGASNIPTVSTVQVIDPIEPQPEPVYAATVGPDQNQYYKLEASSKSDAYIAFNNMTTLGKDRAYLDTMELEITAAVSVPVGRLFDPGCLMPVSFPFNSCCDLVKLNINGGAFMNSPLRVIRAKERYWDERKIQESFGNHCPCTKAYLQNELASATYGTVCGMTGYPAPREVLAEQTTLDSPAQFRSRMFNPCTRMGNAWGTYGPNNSSNFSILKENPSTPDEVSGEKETLLITWREPIFCSPLSSRYDATYGRPLYNITSFDISFNMTDLKNMFLVMGRADQTGSATRLDAADYEVHFKSVYICYQVMTVTAPLEHSFTVVPYRRYVPFLTDITSAPDRDGFMPYPELEAGAPSVAAFKITQTTNVYTLNEVPTAIWLFVAPQLDEYQNFHPNGRPFYSITDSARRHEAQDWSEATIHDSFYKDGNAYTNNKLFGFIENVSITCGNTTQILSTASTYDLYRIAKQNGCQDTYEDWARPDPTVRKLVQLGVPVTGEADEFNLQATNRGIPVRAPGCGSVLRLVPGVDIVLPEQNLIPGTNANNLVFQATVTFRISHANPRRIKYAVWTLFEYVGVASITPGNCVITMNPLGDGSAMASAPVTSGSTASDVTQSTAEGSGWLDDVAKGFGIGANALRQSKILSGLAQNINPLAGLALRTLGFGKKDKKDASGGAIMGLGDFC